MTNNYGYIRLYVDKLECPLCCDTDNKIYSTHCGHIICIECINRLICKNKCYKCRQSINNHTDEEAGTLNDAFIEITDGIESSNDSEEHFFLNHSNEEAVVLTDGIESSIDSEEHFFLNHSNEEAGILTDDIESSIDSEEHDEEQIFLNHSDEEAGILNNYNYHKYILRKVFHYFSLNI
jgi:hypothetical protein